MDGQIYMNIIDLGLPLSEFLHVHVYGWSDIHVCAHEQFSSILACLSKFRVYMYINGQVHCLSKFLRVHIHSWSDTCMYVVIFPSLRAGTQTSLYGQRLILNIHVCMCVCVCISMYVLAGCSALRPASLVREGF